MEETTQALIETTTELIQETTTTYPMTTTTLTETTLTASSDVSEGFPDNSDNVIHQFFYTLGVDVDFVPANKNQAFAMSLQLICAIWFISWFFKFLWTTVRDMFKV